MIISKNSVVSFHYKLSEPGQVILEDSHNASPMVYLHGHGGLLAGLEKALEGKQEDDEVNVTLSPEEAYGERDENAIQRVSMKHVLNPGKQRIKYRPGMLVQLNTQNGPQPAVVIKAGLKTLDVDVNHPFAGRTLTFDIKVISVREANEEEIAHGHVHGEGGHQH